MSQSTNQATTTRRDVLKKAAVAGAVAWTAPMVMSSRAFANVVYTGPGEGCCDPETGKGSVNSVTYTYVPSPPGTISSCNLDGVTGALVSSSGDTLTDPLVDVTVSGGTLTNQETDINGHITSLTIAPGGDVTIGLTDEVGNSQTFTIHLSCSEPLCVGDSHGSLRVAEIDSEPGPCSPDDGTNFAWREDGDDIKCLSEEGNMGWGNCS